MPVGYEAGCGMQISPPEIIWLYREHGICQRLFKTESRKLSSNSNCNTVLNNTHTHRNNLQMSRYMCDWRQTFFPVVRIGSPHPLNRKRVWGEEQQSLAGEGVGGPNSDEETDTLPVYYNSTTTVFHKKKASWWGRRRSVGNRNVWISFLKIRDIYNFFVNICRLKDFFVWY